MIAATTKDNLYIIHFFKTNMVQRDRVQRKMVYKEKLTQVGYWNYENLYTMLFEWLKDNQYIIDEKSYKERLSDYGKEITIEWEASKEISDYFEYRISLDWHILGMKDAEVEIDGKKTKTNKGEVEIVFKAEIIKDYEKRWENTPFYKFLRGLYEQYIIRETIDEYELELEEETKELLSDLKSFLRIPVG